MSDWVDGQMDTKTSKNIKFGHELPAKDNNINELSKKSPPMASKNPKKLAESGKINKNLFFLKKTNFIQNDKQLRDLLYEINPIIKILKSTLFFRKH